MQALLNDGKEINIQILNICNLSCVWCGRFWSKNVQYRYMPTYKFREVVNKCVDYGITNFCLTPMMGEPFLDRDIYDKLWFLENHEKVSHYFFATNLLHAEFGRLDGLRKLRLEVSVYGHDNGSYYRNTGYDGYDEFVRKVVSLTKNPTFPVTMYVRFADEPSKPFLVWMKSLEQKGIEVSYEETHNYNWGGLIPEGSIPAEHPPRQKRGVCPTAKSGCVFEDGDVGICYMNDVEKTMIIGNIFHESLADIFASDKYKKVIEDMANNMYTGICEKCNEKW